MVPAIKSDDVKKEISISEVAFIIGPLWGNSTKYNEGGLMF